jgi:cellulose synthase/poly-beta-1,6-N-acetylglucosamine synthase-like glycosyltransferase
VPAYREELVIVRTVESILKQEYAGAIEIIVVDDGSPDDTREVATRAFRDEPRVTVLSKPNGGKASALNHGIQRARHEIIVCLDADTQFEPETIAALVAPLARPGVGAVAGNAKVGNRVNLVTRWQALEYVTSQNLDRRAFALLNCITVIPGAVGAWRRSLILEAGGFTSDTLAEDQDMTIIIRKMGHEIAFAERAIAWTEAPDTLGTLSRQRFRWSFGTLQCAWKHKDALFNRRYGTLGFVALPNTWLFQLLLTAISPLADLMFVFSLFSVWLTFKTHGETYALTDLEHVLMFYGLFLITDWLGAMIAFLMEPDEEKSLSWLIMLQRFVYRQIMYSVVLKSFVAAIKGRVVGWGLLERKATVERTA